jgi:DNA-binding transcriptional regulator GbsR (MarR family)
MNLTPVMEKFVLHWGEMGTRWGVNRTIAQIHALLYLSPEPLPADEIAETLEVARSNVSTSLRELQSWNLVRVTHQIGDRRDHFVARTDPWEMFLTIVEERKRREIEPTLAVLEECMRELEHDRDTPRDVRTRIEAMLGFLRRLTEWYGQVMQLPKATLIALMKLGGKVAALLPKSARTAQG